MKRTTYFLLNLLFIFALLAISNPIAAQEPPHPPAAGHGATGNQPPPGGGAPIDGGLSVLIALGVAYGTRKVLKARE